MNANLKQGQKKKKAIPAHYLLYWSVKHLKHIYKLVDFIFLNEDLESALATLSP